MSYRIWINAFDMQFMSTRTESHRETALGIARALAVSLPDCVVGVDEIQSDLVYRRIGEDIRVSPKRSNAEGR